MRPQSTALSRRNLLRFGGLAAAGIAAPALTGCGGSGSDDDGMEFMYWGSTFEQKAIDAMLEQFEQQNKGSSVEPVYTPEEYDTKMNTLIASNRSPDVAYMGASMGYRLAAEGKLLNLYPYIDKYPELGERLPGTYFWYGKDKMFGTQTANEVMLIWYNREVIDAAGVEPPPAVADDAWTWDEFVDTAYKLTLDHNGKHPDESGFDPSQIEQFGVSVSMLFAPTWDALLRSRGTSFADEAGTKCLLDTPEAIEVFQNLQDLIYEHRVAPTPAQSGGDDAPPTNVQLQTKRIAMAVDGQWILLDMSQSDLDFGIGVLPKYGEPVTAMIGGASVVFANTEKKQQAVDLYMFHNDPEYVDLFKQGLWMPLEREYYTDQKLIDRWVKNDVHPEEFRTAVVDYTVNNGVTVFSQQLKNMDNVDELLAPALQQLQTGKRSAKEVLTELTPKIDERLQGWHPTQEL